MNSIFNQGYLVKRLKDSGYETWKMLDSYPDADPRKFTLLIDPTYANIWLTCYTNHFEHGSDYFELHDGGQYIPYRFKINTDSFEVLAKQLNDFGIVKKFKKHPK